MPFVSDDRRQTRWGRGGPRAADQNRQRIPTRYYCRSRPRLITGGRERSMFPHVTVLTILAILTAVPAQSQERFSFFQASTPENVEQMLTMAGLRDDDVVVDLGSGNGLIPLTAARMNPRLRGLGVDIDPALVEQSNQRAKSEGVADRVRFEHRNAFDADLRQATVVTMWLFPELMSLLRPMILERARPGTRVVTSTWGLGSWQPDEMSTDGTGIYMWIVPARIAGAWEIGRA